jgi:transposase-like protein
MRDAVRYSETFKLRLVEEMSSGKYRSLNEASRRNGICGCATLSKRIKQYGREDVPLQRIKVETMNETDELREVRGRIRELEATPASAHMDYCLESAFFGHSVRTAGDKYRGVKKKERYNACRAAKEKGDGMKIPVTAQYSGHTSPAAGFGRNFEIA